MTRNFVAFDLGAESGRAVLGTLDNGKLSLTEKHRFANPTGRILGRLQWNLLAQWEELKTGLRKCAAPDAIGNRVSIHGIGVDTWGVDYGLIDQDGQVMGNPYHYRDARTQGMVELAVSRVPRAEIFQQTGVQFMLLNTLFQVLAESTQQPHRLKEAATLLFMPDLFHYLFTGVRKAEFSIVSTSQMYDPVARQWAKPLLEKLSIPTHMLPEIIPSGTHVGDVLPEVAAECGIPGAIIPVIAPASHDTASAVAAVPADDKEGAWCYISSGTWSLMGVEIDKPLINDKTLKYNYTNEGGVGGTIRFLKNIMGLWLVQECRRYWVKEGYDHNYTELTQMAARSRGLVSLINLEHPPLYLPGDMPLKLERYCRDTKQQIPSARGDFVRACLDSLALTYRKTLLGLEDVLGRKIQTIHIVGGGCQNELLSQMTADACNRPVVAGPIEGTAIGNILVQAMATGDVKSLADARSIVRGSFLVKRYEPGDTKVWDAAWERFSKLPI